MGEEGRLEDDPRSGRATTSSNEENTDHVQLMTMNNIRFTINQIDIAIRISSERIKKILQDECFCSTCVTSSDVKRTRLIKSRKNLKVFEVFHVCFVKSFLTQDECSVYHFEPETKKKSMHGR